MKSHSLKIAIASGKGGTGKTLVSTNLALYLSESQPVLLVDLDVEEPNDFIFIKGIEKQKIAQYKMIPDWDSEKCSFCGLCSKNCKYHAVIQLGKHIAVFKELCHSCYACSELCPENALPMKQHKMGEITVKESKNLHFVESRLQIGEEQAVPLIHKTHQFVNSTYSQIPIQIFDCPPGTSCPVIAAAKESDFVILVTEPTPFGLNDLKLAVETIKQLQKPMGVVINRYGYGNQEVEWYCKRENIPILAKIPFDKEIAVNYSKGNIAYQKVPELKSVLEKIVNKIFKLAKHE